MGEGLHLKEEEGGGKGDVLVEGVLDQAPQPVVCQRAMHQQQPLQEPDQHQKRSEICT